MDVTYYTLRKIIELSKSTAEEKSEVELLNQSTSNCSDYIENLIHEIDLKWQTLMEIYQPQVPKILNITIIQTGVIAPTAGLYWHYTYDGYKIHCYFSLFYQIDENIGYMIGKNEAGEFFVYKLHDDLLTLSKNMLERFPQWCRVRDIKTGSTALKNIFQRACENTGALFQEYALPKTLFENFEPLEIFDPKKIRRSKDYTEPVITKSKELSALKEFLTAATNLTF